MISNDFRLQNINGDVISACKEFSKSHQKQLKAYVACVQMLELRMYVRLCNMCNADGGRKVLNSTRLMGR